MDKLEEAKKLAMELEFAHDAAEEAEARLDVYEYPWRHKMDVLASIIDEIDVEMAINDGVMSARLMLDEAKDNYAYACDGLASLARELIDDEAFFPSGGKSQVLTSRVMVKSQMPSLPTVIDPMILVEALIADKRFREFVKEVSIKLDNDVAEAIMRWWAGREERDIGLEAPKPKILNIKVKEMK